MPQSRYLVNVTDLPMVMTTIHRTRHRPGWRREQRKRQREVGQANASCVLRLFNG
ncbi:hypothetical protein [Xanthomonas fragariae]|uniref:hypothetical protein n=1 Tax=Xanthomonas fragariae TaxID=48664 RepID=UPI0022A9FD36|nr:hypothetical protein [Xanthomonas fragariae]WAT14974.1 hypothetical protein OZ429_19200 [Xanthomonas fragariae]